MELDDGLGEHAGERRNCSQLNFGQDSTDGPLWTLWALAPRRSWRSEHQLSRDSPRRQP